MVAKIYVKDIAVDCILGVGDRERSTKQTVIINLTFSVDAEKSSKSDDVNDTVNYHTLADKVVEMVAKSRFHLLEALVQEIFNLCKKEAGVLKAKVEVRKPHILPYSEYVSLAMSDYEE